MLTDVRDKIEMTIFYFCPEKTGFMSNRLKVLGERFLKRISGDLLKYMVCNGHISLCTNNGGTKIRCTPRQPRPVSMAKN